MMMMSSSPTNTYSLSRGTAAYGTLISYFLWGTILWLDTDTLNLLPTSKLYTLTHGDGDSTMLFWQKKKDSSHFFSRKCMKSVRLLTN